LSYRKRKNMKTSPTFSLRPIILFLLFLLIFSIVYSPVLYFNYLFHDDVFFWAKLNESGFKPYYFDGAIFECRYGDAFLLTLENFFVHSVSDFRFLRFLAILISSGSAYFLFVQMRRLSFSNIQSFLIASAIFFLPGFADIICSGGYSSIASLSILLACWSFHQAETNKRTIIPAIAFLLSLTIYPPATMFYWTLTGIHIIFIPSKDTIQSRNSILRLLAIGLLCILLYAIGIFMMHYFFIHRTKGSLYDPYVFSFDWAGKLRWFLQEPMGNVLNLWNIFPKTATSIMVSGFIVFTAVFTFARKIIVVEPQQRKAFTFTCLGQLILFIFISLLCFLPNLAAKVNAPFYRCLIPLTSLICFVLVWAIFQWIAVIPLILTRSSVIALLCLTVVWAGIKTHHNVLCYRVLPSSLEYKAYKSMAKEILLKKIDAIHVLLPYPLSIQRYDEFGVISSHYTFDIYPLIYCVFQEEGEVDLHAIPTLYVSHPGDHELAEMKEIFITRLPNGKWVGKDINRNNQFYEVDHTYFGDTSGLISSWIFQPMPVKRQNWYVLNLSDTFSPSNYSILIRRL